MKVKIKMKMIQHLEDGETQTIENFYRGKRIDKNGKIYISFLEYDTVKDSNNTIKISDDEVLILRSGEIISKMKFKEEEGYRSDYKTPYGVFDMSLYTYKIAKKIEDESLKLNLDYKIDIKDLMSANNRMEIKITSEV